MDPTVNLPRLAASFLRASSSPCHQARHRALHRSPCLRCCASRRRWRRRDRWQLPKRRVRCGAGDRFRQSGCGTKSARFSMISAANIATSRVHLHYFFLIYIYILIKLVSWWDKNASFKCHLNVEKWVGNGMIWCILFLPWVKIYHLCNVI